jgi:S1-C subfamily serine protease
MKKLTKIAEVCAAFLIGASLAILALASAFISLEVPTLEETQEAANVSPLLSDTEQKAVKKSRQSTVRVLSMTEYGEIASSSGTYITAGDKYYVVTVMHGIRGTCERTRVRTAAGFTDCVRFTVTNEKADYAIIEIDQIPSLEAVGIPASLPKGHEWKSAIAAQTEIYYTGFPNNAGPLTFNGRTVGCTDEGFIYLDSFAWGGSSGSGVFTADGKFIGYILAIDLGHTEFGISPLENIVIMVPAFNIDWAIILE